MLPELRWWPIVAAAIAGIALVGLLGVASYPVVSVTTDEDIFIRPWVALLGYFAAGLIASFSADWKGAAHGAFSAMLVWFGIMIYSFVAGIAYGPASQEPEFPMVVVIAGALAIGIGSLGGFVGERMRR